MSEYMMLRQRMLAAVLSIALALGGLLSAAHVTPAQARAVESSFTPASYFVHFTCDYAKNKAYGRICVHVEPRAALTITIIYTCVAKSATGPDLRGTFFANGRGYHSFWWVPNAGCAGWAVATVRAVWHGYVTQNEVTFWVA
jgi:hypothetical protein